ncbi:hypothetical protein CYMTET_18638 [Cymbomonas tetramitiformis]|uniref:HAT C-terminal dimerisation domain-containing protein n=1 Tax=Cymbomonas tetramitiformis TaxID=36881 RepID=A0AAE0G5R9_9CHLO|nr:hypothetical protein CYMTET_19562 [Cymbomonas tetramitiformis]KAK3273104.1 hypothetical protein CYMTET_18638 [Cymbomonas tetramitiformis]
MWERLIQQKLAVKAVFTDAKYVKYAEKQDWCDLSEEVSGIVSSPATWKMPELLMKYLEPVYMFLRLTDGDTPCVGKIYYKFFTLASSFDQIQGLPAAKRTQLKLITEQRWEFAHSDLHCAGFCVDPEYWDSDFGQESNHEVMQGFRKSVRKLTADEAEVTRVLDQWVRFRMGEGLFADEQCMAQARALPAYKWWLTWGSMTPDLQNFSVRVLSQVACSSSCERINSEADYIKSKKRNRMRHATHEREIYVHHNLQVLDKLENVEYEEPHILWDATVNSDEDTSDAGSE